MEVVINNERRDFGLNDIGSELYFAKKGIPVYVYHLVRSDTHRTYVYHRKDVLQKNVEYSTFCLKSKDFGEIVTINTDAFLHYPAWWDADIRWQNLMSEKEYRTDPHLIEVIRELGKVGQQFYSKAKIVKIPDNCFWHILESNGYEKIIYSKSEIKSVD